MNDNLFIYKVGETLLMELKDIEDVTYEKKESPENMFLTLSNGEKYTLTLVKNQK